MRLEGRVAVVTGAAGSIGSACAAALAAEGSMVVAFDLPGSEVEAVAASIGSAGGRAVAATGDVSEETDVASMVQCAMDTFGRLDVLHNNAAATDPEQAARDGDVVGLEVDVFDRALAVNLRGPLLGCKHAIPMMLRSGGGSIVNTSSVSALMGDLRSVAYAVSKGGLNTLTRYVATQYGKQGIRCNAVMPGVITTPGVMRYFTPELIDVYEGNHLTPRLGVPDDIAHLVVFLASDDAAFVTGQVIAADGGMCSHMPTVAQFTQLA